MSQRYFIDVGGVVYATTRRTLAKCTLIEKMMQEYETTHANETNALPLFVDRDGFYFQYVLNFLRNNTVALADRGLIDALLHEAAFFKLREMERQLSEM